MSFAAAFLAAAASFWGHPAPCGTPAVVYEHDVRLVYAQPTLAYTQGCSIHVGAAAVVAHDLTWGDPGPVAYVQCLAVTSAYSRLLGRHTTRDPDVLLRWHVRGCDRFAPRHMRAVLAGAA